MKVTRYYVELRSFDGLKKEERVCEPPRNPRRSTTVLTSPTDFIEDFVPIGPVCRSRHYILRDIIRTNYKTYQKISYIYEERV